MLADLRCACGSDAVVAVDPGQEPETCELLGTVLTLKAGKPIAARCEACWPLQPEGLPHAKTG